MQVKLFGSIHTIHTIILLKQTWNNAPPSHSLAATVVSKHIYMPQHLRAESDYIPM